MIGTTSLAQSKGNIYSQRTKHAKTRVDVTTEAPSIDHNVITILSSAQRAQLLPSTFYMIYAKITHKCRSNLELQ